MTVDRKQLRERAQAATPGYWREGAVEKHNVFVECRDPECLGTERVLLKMNTHFEYEADTAFIAAANPKTVIELLDYIERLEQSGPRNYVHRAFHDETVAELTKAAELAASKGVAAGKLIAAAELEAMTKARDEACDIFEQFVDPARRTAISVREGDALDRIAELRKVGAKETGSVSTPVCSTCNDTHSVPYNGTYVMCTRCPTPCGDCRRGGSGPYCAKTPCSCECHRRTR